MWPKAKKELRIIVSRIVQACGEVPHDETYGTLQHRMEYAQSKRLGIMDPALRMTTDNANVLA